MNNALIVAQLVLELANRLRELAALQLQARAEGRDITDEEVDTALAADNASRSRLDEAIARAKAEGR